MPTPPPTSRSTANRLAVLVLLVLAGAGIVTVDLIGDHGSTTATAPSYFPNLPPSTGQPGKPAAPTVSGVPAPVAVPSPVPLPWLPYSGPPGGMPLPGVAVPVPATPAPAGPAQPSPAPPSPPAAPGTPQPPGAALPGMPSPGLPLFTLPRVSLPGAGPDQVPDTGHFGANDGAHVVSEQAASQQVLDVTVYSPALGGNTAVRLLLPHDWYARPDAIWPTLYLLPGYNDYHDDTEWTAYTDLAGFMADKDVLTVLPSDGVTGFFSNWWNGGQGGTPSWENYHTGELPQLLKADFRSGGRQAIGGLSLGGYGAMAYATKHPGMYQAVASYSGLLNTTLPGIDKFVQVMLRNVGQNPDGLWGDPLWQSRIWQANDPWWHAAGLRGTRVFVSCGTGVPGPHDAPLLAQLGSIAANPDAMLRQTTLATLLEAGADATTQSFVTELHVLGIPVTTDYTPTGTHSWAYWQDAFHRSWPVLAAGLGVS